MMPPRRWARVLLASLVAVPLAVVSGAQALSSTVQRRAPERALAVFAWNGLAQEEAAFRTLAAASPGIGAGARPAQPRSAALARSALAAAPAARAALRREPLAVRAHVVLALAAPDRAAQARVLGTAARLTRRDLTLQTLLLAEFNAAGDYAGAINTLDTILRVHPEQRDTYFPALVQTLAEEPAAIPVFARLLSKPLPWRESFLSAAVALPVAADNLAAVRERIVLDNPEFDRKLIARLAADGRIALAERLYERVAPSGLASAGQGWRADFPPFDWQLANQPGLRAQMDEEAGVLEVSVRPGNGGVIATRLLHNPGAPFALVLAHGIEPAAQSGDLRLAVACAGADPGAAAPLIDQPFSQGRSIFAVERVPACPYLALTITARAWTGGRAIKAKLSPLEIGPSGG
jgi:hypothetical protein